jgi:hypothetical protein
LSRDAHEKLRKLQAEQQQLRRSTEKAVAAEEIQQCATSGLKHLAVLLNCPLEPEEATIGDLIYNVENMLDTLVEEREKRGQHNESPPRTAPTRDGVSRLLLMRLSY